MREPQLLLLDEPFAALDALTRYRMHDLVLSLWRTHRPAVLIVTHDVEEAIALASFQHVFSHFKLHITPWLLQVDKSLLAEPVAGQQWQDHDALEQTALPAPIRKLLLGLYQSKESEQLLLS